MSKEKEKLIDALRKAKEADIKVAKELGKEFDLSNHNNDGYYHEDRVKEFIRRLKDRDNNFCRILTDEEFNIFLKETDKLAGDKLVE